MSKIMIIGAGYVGLAHACVFSKKHNIILVDNDDKKLSLLKNKISPIKEKEIQKIIKTTKNIKYCNYIDLDDVDIVFICLPTDYTEDGLDTTVIRKVLDTLDASVPIVIKSTVPVGFTDSLNNENIVFSPEFLREGEAYNGLSNPNRLIVGAKNQDVANKVVEIYKSVLKSDVPILIMGTKEAETTKLFSNTYLAMRVAFFNILDNYSIESGLNVKEIITGMSYDNRIGNYYNNPSFGFGGYCLPKDTYQVLLETDSKLIESILDENNYIRVSVLRDSIHKRFGLNKNKVIGVYNYSMKANSDNDRESSTLKLIKLLENDFVIKNKGTESLEEFANSVDLIVVNRMTEELLPYKDKVFTRDIFNND